MDIRSPLSQAIASALAGILFLNPIVAAAAELAVDAAAGGNTQLGAAGNGVPVVNIATPNGAGLSHNKFTDFNVGPQGLILNNATQKTQTTQLGGIIVGNPNLAGGAAQKILNEVTGANPSQLRGYTEVAGQGAHVIVANPHGISCNGCGFINTPRATLTTGKPILDGERLQGYDVNGGEISIDGAGLNASNLDKFELIARATRLNAELYANQLDVVTGRNRVDAENLTASAKADDGSAKPQLAIDSSALGGMYAGAIRLVGTEQGVGVKLAGNMAASAGDIQIDANGQLSLAQTSSAGSLRAKAQDITLTGPAYAAGNAELTASGQLSNRQSLAAGQRIQLSGAQISNSGIVEAGVNPDNSRNAQGDLAISAQSLRNSGSLVASRNLGVTTGGTLDNQGGSLRGATTSLTVGQLNNAQGRLLADGALTLSGQQLSNYAGEVGAQTLQVQGGALDNRQGLFSAEQSLSLHLASLDNRQRGTLSSRGSLTLSASGALNNSADGLIDGATVTLTAADLDNRAGAIQAGEHLNVTTPRLNQQGGRLSSDGLLTLDLQGGSLDNGQGGLLSADQLNLRNLGSVANQGGEISSQQAFSLSAQRLDNRQQGRIISAGVLTLHADQLLNAGLGLLSGWQGLVVSGGSLDNQNGGTLSSKAGALSVTLNDGLDNRSQGALVSQGDQQISAARLDNRGGIVSGQGNVTLALRDQLDNGSGGLIDANHQLHLNQTSTRLNNQGGQISAGSLLLKGQSLDNSGGQLLSQGSLDATLGGDVTNTGGATLASAGELTLRAARLNNQGGQLASQAGADLTLTQGDLDNSHRGTLASRNHLTLKVQNGRLLNGNDGLLSSGAGLSLNATGLDNRLGLLSAQGPTRLILSDALNNAQGRIQNESGTLTVQSASTDNSGGILNAVQGLLTLVTGTLNNSAGVAQGQTADITATGGIGNQQGHLAATTGALTLDTGSAALDNQNGGLYAGTTLDLSAGDLHNAGGQVGAQTLDLDLSGALHNSSGLIEASDQLQLAAASLDNQQGRLRALGQSGTTRIAINGLLDNRQGTLETAADTLHLSSGALRNEDGTILHVGNGQLLIDLAQLGQAGGHVITQAALDIEAPDWTLNGSLQARELTVNVGQLQIGAGGQLLAVQRLSGQGSNWTNDGLIASDGSLDLDLTGTYGGNGRLTSLGELSASARHIDLTSAASITGGANATVSAQTLDNRGRLTAAGDLTANAGQLSNYGTLGSAGNLRIQGQNLLNENGLIFSGGDMVLRVSSLTNRYGDIYSVGSLDLAADDNGGRAARLDNLSSTLESHGDMRLNVGALNNQRVVLVVNNAGKYTAQIIEVDCYKYFNNNTADCDGGKENQVWEITERDKLEVLQASAASSINADGNLTLSGDTLTNASSVISAGQNLYATLTSLSNQGVVTGETETLRVFRSERTRHPGSRRDEADAFTDQYWIDSPNYRNDATGLAADLSHFIARTQKEYPQYGSVTQLNRGDQTYAGIIQAAGDVNINASSTVDNSVIRNHYTFVNPGQQTGNTAPGSSPVSRVIPISAQLPPDLAQRQVNPLSLPGFSLPTGSNGLFRLSGQDGSQTQPSAADLSGLGQGVARVQGVPSSSRPSNSHRYLIETNPELTSLKSFLGSDYLLGQLGYDPDQAQKRLGDGLYEQRLVRDAVMARTGQRYLDGLTSDEALFKYLMDNAIAYKDSLHLQLGVTLSAEQVAALTHDLVWLEEAEVNGEKVLVPVLYLAQANHRLAPNGALIAGNDVSLISGGALTNQGTLRASRDLAASATNLNNSGLIEASKRLDLLALDSIRNAGGGIINGRDVSLTALTGDVINERSVSRIDSAQGNRTWTHSFADSAARIEAAGSLDISAGRDIHNRGGAISSGRDLTLQAGRDINLTSVEVENGRTHGRNYSQSTTQLGSEISAGNNLDLNAGRDITAVASQLDAQGDAALSAGRNVTLASAANEQHSYSKTSKVTSQQDHVHQQSTELTAGGDVLISAGDNITLKASKIGAGDEAYLVAGDKIELLAENDSDYSLYDMKKKGSWGSKKTQHDEVTDVKAIGSEISAGSDITLLSGGDQKYQAAKLQAGNDIALVSGGSITFEAVKDLHQEAHDKSDSDLAWTSSSGKGKTDETLRQTQLLAQGDLAIKAVDGLKIDYKHLDRSDVSQAIDAMVQADPNLAWLKEAEQRGDVDWRAVKELHDSYSYSQSGLGAAPQLIIAIVASYFLGPLYGAMASNLAVGTINNGGDIGQGLKYATTSDALKGYAMAGIGEYVISPELNSQFGVTNENAYQVTKGFDLSTWGMKGIGGFAAYNGAQGLSQALMQQAAYGGSFADNLGSAMGAQAASLAMAVGFHSVGDWAQGAYGGDVYLNGSPQKIIAHALMGGLLAEATGSDFKTGAMAAGINEALANVLSNWAKGDPNFELMASQIVGVLAATAVDGDVNKGAEIAKNATAYNRQLHPEEQRQIREKAKELEEQYGKLGLGSLTWEQLLTVESGRSVDQAQSAEYLSLLKKLNSGNPDNPIKAKFDYARDIVDNSLLVMGVGSQPLRWANGDPIIAHGQPVYAFQATPEQFADSNLFNDPYRGNSSSAAWANLNRALAQYGQGQTDSHNGEIAGFKGQTELQQYLRDALGLTVGDVALRDTTLEENFLPLGAPMGKGLSAAASKTAQLTQAVLSGIDAKLTERALQREWRASLADFLTDVAPYESPTPGLPQMGWWGPLDKGVVGSAKGTGTAGKVADEFIPPGMERPFRPVNPEFPPNKAVVEAMESPRIKGMTACDGTDCSEIASKLLAAAGGKGKVIEVRPAQRSNLNLYENGGEVQGQAYHQVYTDGRYVYDPRLSSQPIPKGDWEQHIKGMNPDGVTISDKLQGLR